MQAPMEFGGDQRIIDVLVNPFQRARVGFSMGSGPLDTRMMRFSGDSKHSRI